jgi:two-component system sensor histidine kinase/response regulator
MSYIEYAPGPLVGTAEAPPATILVVDDEPNNLEVLQGLLGAEGFNIVSAADGEAALLSMPGCRPDLVMLDVRMPGLDGFEVCRRIKDDPATTFVPVVIVTALQGSADRLRGVAAGADEFLSKPYDHVELITRVKALLRYKRYHDEVIATNAVLEQRVAERTQELERALAEQRSLDHLKSEFITNVSHELRTPLQHVKGYIDLLADGAMGNLTAKQAEGLSLAQDAVDRLENVVDDIVDFSSLDESALTFEPIYVLDVCRNVINSYSALASRRKVNITLSIAPDLPMVNADRVAITRVLRHLLDNAIKFGPPNQIVQIQVDRQGERVRLAVRDHGPGLAPNDVERIFDVFYQVDGSATRKAGGLGVGLALVRKLVEAHGSQVTVTSELGKGSTFSFELAAVD